MFDNVDPVTLSLLTDTGATTNAQLSCDSNPVTVSSGVANFTCSIDTGGSYELVANTNQSTNPYWCTQFGNPCPAYSSIIQISAGAPAAPAITGPAGGSDQAPTFTVTGTGVPGATVTIGGPGGPWTGTVGSDGNWSVPVSLTQAGAETLSVTQTVGGQASGPATLPVSVTAYPPTNFTVSAPGGAGYAQSPSSLVFGGGGPPGATVQITAICNASPSLVVPLPPTVIPPGGIWSYDPSVLVNLNDCQWTFLAKIVYGGGLTSSSSSPVGPVTIDSTLAEDHDRR